MKYVFDSPFLYPGRSVNDHFAQGNSPTILAELINYLNSNIGNINRLRFALYLYNNPLLHDTLKNLVSQGIQTEVYSIPLEGYDNTYPKNLIDVGTGQIVYRNVTKYDMAKNIYDDVVKNPKNNVSLYIFPHVFLRSEYVYPFSRGSMPYSLHIKSFIVEMKDGTCIIGLTSSNLATRDLCKFEAMLMVIATAAQKTAALQFFDELKKYSFPISQFNPSLNWFQYQINASPVAQGLSNLYTAPFFTDSSVDAEDKLKLLIGSAKKRILISAQHISSFDYTIPQKFTSIGGNGTVRRDGILASVLNLNGKTIDIRILSQTYVDEKGSSSIGGKSCREPMNKSNFSQFVRAFKNGNSGSYRVNENLHEKYIIIDDVLVMTTSNFTPTQFIYLPNVNITKFQHIPNLSYKGIHAEIGQFVQVDDITIVNAFRDRFESIWNHADTLHAYTKI